MPNALLALRFAASHILMMSFGTVMPSTDGGYLVAFFSMLVGVVVNAFVFSAVVSSSSRRKRHRVDHSIDHESKGRGAHVHDTRG